MSHTLNRDGERRAHATASVAQDAFTHLNQMMRQGRSFSGNERHCCFLNTGDSSAAAGRFADISAASGLDFADDGRAVALVDWDQDGDLDLWISNRNAPRLRFLRNDIPRSHHFLLLRLEGNGKTTNRDAIGARVEVSLPASRDPHHASRNRLIRTLRAGEGFLAQSTKWLHFGLGRAGRIEFVTVRWPDGQAERFSDLEVDTRYRLVQGTGQSIEDKPTNRQLILATSVPTVAVASSHARLPLVAPVHPPRLTYLAHDGRKYRVNTKSGKPVLINLWSSTCQPCLVELDEFSKRAGEIRAAGIDLLALSVDEVTEEFASSDGGSPTVVNMDFPFASGRATASLLDQLQSLHDTLMPVHTPLPLPSSFLIDASGRLSVIYKGALSVDELLTDATRHAESRIDRYKQGYPFPGLMIEHDVIVQAMKAAESDMHLLLASGFSHDGQLDEAVLAGVESVKLRPDAPRLRLSLGYLYLDRGDPEQALIHFQKALDLEPDYPEAHFNLGSALFKLGKHAEAQSQYEQALRLKPDYAQAHNNLGKIAESRKDLDQAIAYYRRALETNQEYVEAHYNLGNALMLQRRIADAQVHYEEAVRLQPDHADAHHNLGTLAAQQRDFERAAQHYRRAVSIKPSYAVAHFNLAQALEARHDLKQAREYYRKSLALANAQGRKQLAHQTQERLQRLNP